MKDSRTFDILLVEDNPGDALLVREAFKEFDVPNRVHHVVDGVEAMTYLRQEDRFKDVGRPDVVLLDLNLPRMDGREVLSEMKKDGILHQIPVVALTTSSNETDIEHCYKAGVNAYIVKPVEYDEFVNIMKLFERFWFQTVRLPVRAA